ncbi:hypothetical protein [Parabacteroides sp. Marseille-P3160]|uniref:hypothetical protein n=1 Tax=Parabacteroides sp. Marseille-P3160 TaxID=1917887 RepID=UPI0009BB1292|nr:hypothetical protein [Parabacteroides sp. Marseille-P3160]
MRRKPDASPVSIILIRYKMNRYPFLILCFLLFFINSGCRRDVGDFVFSCSIESVTNYKIVITIKSDRTYAIEEFHYFFDNASKKKDPKNSKGILTAKEFDQIKTLIEKSNLFHLKDAYGFDNPKLETSAILYQVYLKSADKEKFISMKEVNADQLPPSFIQLVKTVNDFMSHAKAISKQESI